MKKASLPIIFLFFLIGLAAMYSAGATSKDDIQYPVRELGNCANETECRAYCDDLNHIQACLAFAEQHNLLSAEELTEARKFAQLKIESGPGGCQREAACEAYCEDISHIDECLRFAEQHGIMEEEELQEARQVAEALRLGAQLPGGCQSKESCEAYCEDPSHMRECLDFAESAGFIPADELAEARQVLRALESGARLPGGCREKEACEAYCQESSHIEECFEFAVAAGFIPPEEVEQARKIMPLMAKGEMPGGCRSKEQCETYCSQGEHMEECIVFFEKAGFISAEELEIFRKTGGKGPGGCQGREACESFCNNPANQSVCFAFAKEHGLIPEEELEHMKEGMAQLKTGLQQAPPEVTQCLKERIGEEVLAKIEAGTFMPNPELGEHMRGCFEEFSVPSFEGAPGGFEGMAPEQIACIERVLGGTLRPFTPEEQQRIAAECFGAPSGGGGEESIIQNIQEQITSCIEQRIRSLGGFPSPEQEQQIRQECFAASGQTAPELAPAGTPLLEVGPERRSSILSVFSPFLALLLFAL